MKSIQTRLNLAFVAISLIAFVVLWFSMQWFLRQTAYESVSSRLSSDAFALLRAVEMDDRGEWQMNPEKIDPVYQQPMSGHYFQLEVNDDWHFSRSLWDARIPVGEGMPVGQENVRQITKDGKPWLILDERFMKQGRSMRLVLAEDVSRIERSLNQLGWLVAGIGMLFLAGMLLIQVVVIRRGLCSLVDVQEQISRLKQGEIRQLPHAETSEVEPLVTEINYLVQSIELRLQRSRNSVGNLAHAAKTPLTVIDRHIEALRQKQPACADAIAEQSKTLRDLMHRELTRARIAGAALPGQRVYLSQELEKLERTLKAIYREKAIHFQNDINEQAFFPGERDDLMELLGNLLDNACKWTTDKVRISAESTEQCVSILVEDNGPGIAEEQRDRLMARGERLDESTDGHGLGMSIISDIVKQYGGVMVLDRSERLGGLRARVRFPSHCDAKIANSA
ncbi:ATP-binding protein [Marinobacterium jannaschii]|uniref:ATP-binding protein n=1 Tax=Marinobacterium jannaschii TaxID=64970 RepID=UPI000B2E8DB9|nr:sensor histidine kinase [Marinobacterium jannaschii]